MLKQHTQIQHFMLSFFLTQKIQFNKII